MSDDPDTLAARYHLDLAACFVRGKLPDALEMAPAEAFHHGLAHGLHLHKFKRTDLPRIRRVLGLLRSLAPAELLDIGSGRGVFLWPLLEAFPGLSITACDLRADRVADLQAVVRGGADQLQAVQGDVTQFDFPDRTFDGVTVLEVLEHVPDPARAVRELVRVARRFVIASVPSKPDDNPEHIHLFTRQSLSELFASAGVNRVSVDFVLNHMVALALVGT